MTIPFQGAPGDLFNALGALGQLVKQVASYQSSQHTNYTTATAQLANQSDIQAQIGGAYLNDLQGPEVSCQTAQFVAGLFLNRLVYLDTPQPNQDLTTVNLSASLIELIRQMKLNGVTVLRMTVGATPGPTFSNVYANPGNPVIVMSTLRGFDGLPLENSFAEEILVVCNGDSYTGGQTAFNETFAITGENIVSDVFAWNWPKGSGTAIQINAIDGDSSNSSGNLLTNSGFATWTTTPNVPNNWVLALGTAGVNTFEEIGLIYSGGSSLKITGDAGGTLTMLTQQFNLAAGTLGTLLAETQYSFNIFLRGGAAPLGSGILQIDLTDINGNIIKDDSNNSNSFTIDLTTLNTVWTPFNVAFRLPYNLPSKILLRMHLTTALPNGGSFYLGKASLGQMTQMYVSGPFIAIHAGNIPSVQNDYNTAQVTNSRGSGGTLSTWQTLFNQFYNMQGQDLMLPSSSTPTVSDSLI